ncbi:hypothetical protein C8R44DRAFT_877874 [Mycena epipterygia]|nr:hypothetical protein C8R44DRAFT_877874 [Mycena epipterygia]
MAFQVIDTFINALLNQYPDFAMTPTLRDNLVSALNSPTPNTSDFLNNLLDDAAAPWGLIGAVMGFLYKLMKEGSATQPDGVGAIAQQLQSMTVWLILRFAMPPRSPPPTASSPSSCQAPAAAATHDPAAPLASPSTRSPSPSLSDFEFADAPSKVMRVAAARWDEDQPFRLSPVPESECTTDESGDGEEGGEKESITYMDRGKGKPE